MPAKNLRRIVQDCLGEKGKQVDDTIIEYICSILEDTAISGQELADTVSPLLLGAECVNDEKEAEILCSNLLSKIRGTNAKDGSKENGLKKLSSNINLAQSLASANNPVALQEQELAWLKPEERESLVNQGQLEKLEAKKEKKKELRNRREQFKTKEKHDKLGIKEQTMLIRHSMADATKSRDIQLENFDIAFGKEYLMLNCNLSLIYGHRYGLVGRNGSGKSTLLYHISNREIHGIPSHLSILHVEQEVDGTDISAVDNVLECDVERTQLLEKETLLLKDKEDNALQLAKVYERLQEIDADTAPARASSILAGLGFTEDMQKQPTKSFSGGWRMRIALARALFCKPDVLLLDEPTNHLDLYSCLWLEGYLRNWKGTLLVVSHQREFLNGVTTDIVHLFGKKLEVYKGNFDAFEQVRYERLLQQQRAREAQQRQRKHVQQFIDRFRYNAKRASLVQSRLKALEKMEVVEDILQDPTITLTFPDPEPLVPPILQFQDGGFSFDGKRHLFRDLNMGVDLDSRVALVGANGVGKSTLLKILTGENDCTSGNVVRHGKLRFARFSQHFVDQLDLDISPLDHYMTKYPGLDTQVYRSHLGSFGLSGDLALRTINTLSGGQKSRLVFSELAWKKPHLLLLDEPTNHLDMETIDSLCKALLVFKGGVLLISHDERLIEMVCDTLWWFQDGKVSVFNGEFKDYKNMLLEQVRQKESFLM